MNNIIYELAEFITTPIFRWLLLFLGVILTLIQYLNSPQRFSYKIAHFGIPFKWYMYILCMFNLFTSSMTTIGQWSTIPFTDKLPDYWYIYIFVLCFAIITQITVDSEQYLDNGSFSPPPTYLLPQKYRVIISYCSLVVDTLLMVQVYIYFGITDVTKKTLLSKYVLERFGGWISGNKLDFLFDWSGMFDVFIKLYILVLQRDFYACDYGLPSSWNA